MCAGTVGCPVMGTRGTHWNLPGKGSLQETSRSRSHGGGEGEHCLGCKSNHYLCRIFLPSGLWEQRAEAGSSRQWGQGPGEEAERDKESVPQPYMAPTTLCLGPGLALSVLGCLRLRGFMGSL